MFSAFLDAITSPELRKIAAHWDAAHGARAVPGWSDIRPAAIASQLPIVWSYKYDRATGDFTGRLAGERIVQVFGKEFRGSPMVQIQPPADFPWVYELCKRVVTEPALYRGAGLVYRHLDRYGKGERIAMPLAGDGVLADGIIGATEYRLEGANVSPDPPREAESWFPLDP